MARLSRLAVAKQPHLLMQVAGSSCPAFLDDVDRQHYLSCLAEMSLAVDVLIHAYALVAKGIYLLATPSTGAALGLFMQRVNRRYVHSFNRRHERTGSMWAARFRAVLIDPEHYLLPAIRFVEQAPVREALVEFAVDWRWSSALAQTGKAPRQLIVQHPAYWRLGNTPFEREARHDEELRRLLTDEQVGEIYGAAKSGWPLGPPAFLDRIASETKRRLVPLSAGRPKS